MTQLDKINDLMKEADKLVCEAHIEALELSKQKKGYEELLKRIEASLYDYYRFWKEAQALYERGED